MPPETNPVTTSTEQPLRDSTGTILNQASPPSQSTTTDSSTTEVKSATTEMKPSTEPKPTEGDDKSTLLTKKDPEAKPAVAPDKYADFTLPEGVKLEPEALKEAQTLFKGLNLPQEAAQSLVDFHAKSLKSAIEGPFNTVAELKKTWEDQARSEFGKDIEPGGKTITSISRLIDSLPLKIASDFREAMDRTIVGSHPGFIKAFAILADRFGEGTTVTGKGPSPLGQKPPDAAPKSIASAMYPHLKSASDPS